MYHLIHLIILSTFLLAENSIIKDDKLNKFKKITNKNNNFEKLSNIITLSLYKEKKLNHLEVFAGANASDDTQNVSINLRYSLYDNKEKREFQLKQLEKLNKINDKARDFFLKKDNISNLKLEKDFYILKEKRLMLRIEQGISNFDERLILLEKIIEINKELSKTKIELQALKIFLTNNILADIKGLL